MKRGLEKSSLLSLAGEIIKPDIFKGRGVVRAWYRLESGGIVTGFLVELSGTGYGGPLSLIALYDPDGTVKALKILNSDENHFRNKQIQSDTYVRHFTSNRFGDIPVVKEMLNKKSLDAISGATISFMAVADAVKTGSHYVVALGGV